MSAKKSLFLAMPSYGPLTAGAARGFWCHPSREMDRFQFSCTNSLLAQGFNIGWAAALNEQARGRALDYYAMQHADVEPEDWWADTLVQEMEAHDLDLLSAVIPIKDQRGRTSTAVAHPSGDPYQIARRLTLKEIYGLPETFTSEDVGGPLLANTGLWVCRWNRDWATKVHFTINDRIVFDVDRGIHVAQVEPEDWNFSRQLHALGLRVGVTRKVAVAHRGDMAFLNTSPWGESFDTEYSDGPLVAPELQEAI